MPDTLRCTRCGSGEVIPRLRVIDRGDDNLRYDLQVEVQRRPNALLFKRPERSTLSAQVCGACGHTELYADVPRALYAAYLQAEASPAVSALEELERTREALADAQIRLHELEVKVAFLDQLLESNPSQIAPPPTERP
jgi:hypothetical protein